MKTNTSSTSSLGAVIREFLAPLAEVVGELEPLHVPLPHAVDVLDAFVELRRLGEAGVVLMSARAVESGAWEGAGQYVDLSQGGFWPDLPGAEYFPQMYRYTLPEHPLFGDARMGGVPYWGVTDLGRNRAINAQVGDLFWDGVFMDDQGLETSPSTEGHWFLAEDEAVVTVVNDASVPVRFLVTLDLRRAGKQSLPTSARAIAAEQDVAPVIWENHVVFEVSVPARQMEAVHLRW